MTQVVFLRGVNVGGHKTFQPSVLAKRPHGLPDLPRSLPADKWLLRLIAIQNRFAFGLYRRQMRAISYLSQLEKRMGMPLTTRNWNTISSIIKVLKPYDAISE